MFFQQFSAQLHVTVWKCKNNLSSSGTIILSLQLRKIPHDVVFLALVQILFIDSSNLETILGAFIPWSEKFSNPPSEHWAVEGRKASLEANLWDQGSVFVVSRAPVNKTLFRWRENDGSSLN